MRAFPHILTTLPVNLLPNVALLAALIMEEAAAEVVVEDQEVQEDQGMDLVDLGGREDPAVVEAVRAMVQVAPSQPDPACSSKLPPATYGLKYRSFR